MAEQKITDAQAQEMACAHAQGASMRALARRYGIAPSLVHRHVHRVNGTTPEAASSGTGSGTESDSEQLSGSEPQRVGPQRVPPETEFPGTVAGFAPDDPDIVVAERSPAEQLREKRRAAGEARMGEDAERERQREIERDARERELVAAAKAAKPGTEEWTRARRELKRFRDARPRYLPMPSETGARVCEQTLGDSPPPNVWDNPHDRGPRGFTVVGS